MTKSVSILTPTYDVRRDFLQFVARGISNQTYKNIKEWVIIDGTREGVSVLPAVIDKIKKLKNIPPIVFIPQDIERKNTVGNLRNILKKRAGGDILINFDDDDFYPYCRIQHTVDKLTSTKLQLAGVSNIYMYDAHFKTLYQFKSFGDNHVLAGTMAYTKKYAVEHDFDEEVAHAEESSFTNKFTEPVAVLTSEKIIVASSHSINTYSKKTIIWNNLIKSDSKKSLFYRSKTLRSINKNKKYIKDYIRTLDNSVENQNTDFNITIFMPGGGADWQNTLDDSFKDISMHYKAKHLHSLGYTVEIYNNLDKYKDIVDGIHYKKYTTFNVSKKYQNVFIIGTHAAWPLVINNIRLSAQRTLIFNPELIEGGYNLYQTHLDEFGSIIFDNIVYKNIMGSKLKFKKYQYQEWEEKTSLVKTSLIRTTNELQHTVIPLSIYICIYNSFDIAGLKTIFEILLPQICVLNPDLKIYVYNLNMLLNKNSSITDKQFLYEISNHPNMVVCEDMSYDKILLEKYKYQFHLNWARQHPNQMFDLLDTIHSSYIGCIPITNWFFTELVPELQWKTTPRRESIVTTDFIEFILEIINITDDDKEKFNTHNSEILENLYTINNWGEQIVKRLV